MNDVQSLSTANDRLRALWAMQEASPQGPEPCYYCGVIATTVDHVVPQCLLETIEAMGDEAVTKQMRDRHRVRTVPACKECNVLLGARYFPTLQKRKEWLKRRLKIRYRKLLQRPDWSLSELAELAPELQRYVIQGIELRKKVERRLAW